MKWKDPYVYQTSVKKRLERDTFSHNTCALAFGKHVAAYKGYLEAQTYLSKKEQDLHILVRALRRFPHLKNVTVTFNDGKIGAQEIMSAFGVLNGNEITFDAEYTLSILVRALIGSQRKLEVLNLCPEERPEASLLNWSRRYSCLSLDTRFKYVAEPPEKVTLKALNEAFRGQHPDHRLEVISLSRHLREFTLSGLNFAATQLYLLGDTLQPLTSQAWQLEKVSICPAGIDMPAVHDPLLHFDSLSRGSPSFRNLRHLELKLVESPASLLLDLFSKNSHSLETVLLEYMRIVGGGTWSNVLRKLRSISFKTLHSFILSDCGGEEGLVIAEDYINRITSKDPIISQMDDSD